MYQNVANIGKVDGGLGGISTFCQLNRKQTLQTHDQVMVLWNIFVISR